MSHATAFRLLIAASFAFAVIASLIDLVVPGLIPGDIQAAYDRYFESEPPASLLIAVVLAAVLLPVLAAGAVGLFLFKRWGRFLCVLATVLGLPLYPMLGAVVESGWSALFMYLSAVSWGLLLGLAYHSPVANRFSAQR